MEKAAQRGAPRCLVAPRSAARCRTVPRKKICARRRALEYSRAFIVYSFEYFLTGFYFPLTVLGACFPGQKDLYMLLGMSDTGLNDHAVTFKQAVEYYENAIRFLYDTLLIKPNMINLGYKPTRYWFQCKILIKRLLQNHVIFKPEKL